MIPVDCIHNRFGPRRLAAKEILSDGYRGVCIEDAGLIIVSNELVRDGEGCGSRRR